MVPQPQANVLTYNSGYIAPSQGYSVPSFSHQNQSGFSPSSQALMVTSPSVYPSVSTGNVFSGVSQALVTTTPPVTGHGQSGQITPQWYFDSGATTHVTNDLNNLSQSQPCSTGDGVVVGNGSSLPITYTGNGLLSTPHSKFHLNHVLHTPSITHYLLSVF